MDVHVDILSLLINLNWLIVVLGGDVGRTCSTDLF